MVTGFLSTAASSINCKSQDNKRGLDPRRLLNTVGGIDWGIMLALDLLQLKVNEGENTSRDLSVPIAASGDLRNFIKTIACLPARYKHLHVDIDDIDDTVVARNLTMLLIAFNLAPEIASVIILHLWYSAFLPEFIIDEPKNKILLIVLEFLKTIVKYSELLQTKWHHNNATLSA